MEDVKSLIDLVDSFEVELDNDNDISPKLIDEYIYQPLNLLNLLALVLKQPS